MYFKEVSEACVCADEARRKEALASLSFDPGLQPLVPRLVAFISEGNCDAFLFIANYQWFGLQV